MIRLTERRYQAVSLFYKEDNEFIISFPLLTLNFNYDNKEIGLSFFSFFNLIVFICFYF